MTIPNTRDIALIFLVLQALIGCAVPLVIFLFITRGLMAVNRKTRETMPKVQEAARKVAANADSASQRVTAPLISLRSQAAGLQGMTDRVRESVPGRNHHSNQHN